MPFVSDAHALAWYLTGDSRLGPRADQVFRDCAAGNDVIVVPSIVLAELMYVAERGRVPISFEATLSALESGDNYEVAALDLVVLREAAHVGRTLELHDRLIVATAHALGFPLISNDTRIAASGVVPVVW